MSKENKTAENIDETVGAENSPVSAVSALRNGIPTTEELADLDEENEETMESLGVDPNTPSSGTYSKTSDSQLEDIAYSHIGPYVGKRIAVFLDQIRGVSAEEAAGKKVENYAEELETMVTDFETRIDGINANIYKRELELNKLGTTYEIVMDTVDNVEKAIEQYGSKIGDLNDKLRNFRNLPDQEVNDLMEEYAPDIKNDSSYDAVEKKLKLRHEMRDKKTDFMSKLRKNKASLVKLQFKAARDGSTYEKGMRNLKATDAEVEFIISEITPILANAVESSQVYGNRINFADLYSNMEGMVQKLENKTGELENYRNAIDDKIKEGRKNYEGRNPKDFRLDENEKRNNRFNASSKRKYENMGDQLKKKRQDIENLMYGEPSIETGN